MRYHAQSKLAYPRTGLPPGAMGKYESFLDVYQSVFAHSLPGQVVWRSAMKEIDRLPEEPGVDRAVDALGGEDDAGGGFAVDVVVADDDAERGAG